MTYKRQFKSGIVLTELFFKCEHRNNRGLRGLGMEGGAEKRKGEGRDSKGEGRDTKG